MFTDKLHIGLCVAMFYFVFFMLFLFSFLCKLIKIMQRPKPLPTIPTITTTHYISYFVYLFVTLFAVYIASDAIFVYYDFWMHFFRSFMLTTREEKKIISRISFQLDGGGQKWYSGVGSCIICYVYDRM